MNSESPAVPLDRLIGQKVPSFASAADVQAFEQIPYEDRIGAASTYDAIQIGKAVNPDAPALQFLREARSDIDPLVISYSHFIGRVNQSANLFNELGVGRDDVVSFLLPLLPQSFYASFGAQAVGIANPVNPLLEPHQLVEILAAAGTKVLVALGPLPDTDIWQKVLQIRDQLPEIQSIVQVGGPSQPDTTEFDQVINDYPSDRLLFEHRAQASDTAAYFHTGGTTGTPKLVRHTHRNQVYQAWVMNTMVPGTAGDTCLFGLPLYHVGGALTQGLATFTAGASVVILSATGWRNRDAVANVWKLVERYRPVMLGAVPTVLATAANVPIENADISSLQYSWGGGSAVPVAVSDKLQSLLGQPVIEVYGMTETSSVHTLAYPERPIRPGSVGHAVPYSQVRVVKLDGDGQFQGDCAPNEIGVVAMAGPGVFSGYLDDKHNANAFVEPGWVNSGDLGRLDEDGYLWITGRAKDLIIRGGHNIDPAGIEEAFYQHPDVALAALVGQPDAYAGELPLAFLQLKPGCSGSVDELLAHVRERTPERAAVPVDIVFVDEMPVTGVGKVFKPALRWQASQRVFHEALEPVRAQGAKIDVTVHADGTHGSLATIQVTGDPASRPTIEEAIDSILNPFVLAHQISWRDK